MSRLPIDKLSKTVRKDKFVRVLVETGDARRAITEGAGFKATPKNIERQIYKMRKDPYVQKKLQELLAEKYPVNQRADDLTTLIQRAVEMATQTNKLNELLATIQTLAKFAGASEHGPPQVRRHLHIHSQAGGVAVKDPFALPEE